MKSFVDPCWRTSPFTRVSIVSAGLGIHLVAHQGTDRAKRVEALGPRPLAVLLLQVARRHVVGQRISAHIAAPFVSAWTLRRAPADDQRQFAFIVHARRRGGMRTMPPGREQATKAA